MHTGKGRRQVKGGLRDSCSEGGGPGDGLVKKKAGRVNVRAHICDAIETRLLRCHPSRRADETLLTRDPRELALVFMAQGARDAEVDDLHLRTAAIGRDKEIGGLQIAMNDAILMLSLIQSS